MLPETRQKLENITESLTNVLVTRPQVRDDIFNDYMDFIKGDTMGARLEVHGPNARMSRAIPRRECFVCVACQRGQRALFPLWDVPQNARHDDDERLSAAPSVPGALSPSVCGRNAWGRRESSSGCYRMSSSIGASEGTSPDDKVGPGPRRQGPCDSTGRTPAKWRPMRLGMAFATAEVLKHNAGAPGYLPLGPLVA